MDIQRISIYTPLLTGRGSSRTVLQLARGFINREFNVDLVLANAEGELKGEIPSEVRVINFDIDTQYPITLTALPKMVEYLRFDPPPVLISTTGGANVVPLIADRLVGADTHIIAKGGVESKRERIKNGNWRGLFMSILVGWTYRWADKVVMGEQNSADKFLQTAPEIRDRLHIIHQPVITDEILSKSHEPIEHQQFDSDEVPVVLAVQRLEEPKDTETLIRAFSRLRNQRDVRLVILGEGDKRPELESLITELELEESVSMPGFVNNPYKYMRNSDLFVLSSKKETLPNALIEAMACGCPVVATDSPPGGVSEILEGEKWGELVPVSSPDAMAAAMQRELCNRVEGIEDRANHYSLDRTIDLYLEAIEDINGI
jgi:glycosyltransferase involved in cell wall biosynthesis